MIHTGHCQKTIQFNNELTDYNAVSLCLKLKFITVIFIAGCN